MFQSQAQECVYESLILTGISQGVLQYSYAAQEAAVVRDCIMHVNVGLHIIIFRHSILHDVTLNKEVE